MNKRSVFVAGLASSLIPIIAQGAANEEQSEVSQLKSAVADLQKQVDAMRGEKDREWLSNERAEQIKGLVQDVLADADTRASLLQSGAVAGYDKNFFLASADGNYLLRIGGQLQFRAVYNNQDESPTDDNRFGFENRRSKLFFWGNIVDPSWEYQLEIEANSSGGGVVLGEFAYIQKNLGNGWKLRAGQFKPPFLREEYVSSKRLFAVERSLVNSQFTSGVSQGIQASYEAEKWRAFGTFNDGNGQRSTAWSAEDTEFALTGRAEFLAMGDWKQFDDYNGFRSDKTGLLLGAGVAYQKSEFGTGSNLPAPDFNNAEVKNLGVTLDASFEMSGFSIAGAFIYRNLDADATGLDLDQYAFIVKGGYFFTDDIEAFAQYEWGDLDISGIDDLSIITVGISKYWDKHNLKWQSDIGFGLNSVASNWAVDSAGWRADSTDNDGQIVIRSQIQLLF